MALTWSDLAFAVVFNCGIAAVCFLVFCTLRQFKPFYAFYNARRRLAIPFRCAPYILFVAFVALLFRRSLHCCSGNGEASQEASLP